jgi:hypothetical protein
MRIVSTQKRYFLATAETETGFLAAFAVAFGRGRLNFVA